MVEGVAKYFLAVIPPSPALDEAAELKNYFSGAYHSKAALNSPPHITLHMPFEWKEKKEARLIEELTSFVSSFQKFEIRLKDFGCFEPRVIFIQVEHSEKLNALQNELQRFCKRTFQLFNADYRDLPYHPHITLAFRDLKKPMFYKAWEEFRAKSFDARFTTDHVALLRHDGKKWNVFHRFSLA